MGTDSSVFADLAGARQKLVEAKKKTLNVPGWGEKGTPSISVTYRPADWSEIDKHSSSLSEANKAGKKKRSEAALDANAQVLVSCATGITITTDDGRQLTEGEDGEPLRFGSQELAVMLGVADRRAIAVCRALFVIDGDLMAHAAQLLQWSGLELRDLEDDYQGE
ncbi:hypothetical protein GTQ99_00205 [Kineococcus sp. T13]|uniref:hypothetical protein n=1 Tax=Kineococcus vitellinus TaxID=2696565 RepID=UPI00141214EA|nr:hypothetical protein [Kineococcus vitellinus]NAZ73852.1 hypothetical protein [Kineococcus vitellinus]